ncbi:hypothetical protein L3X38_020526 [Prunus dulcis]|uniref:Uncharacterized protein n=1 Tax=Prunus dulcis TaxID=3755 RepID=A0AAD4WFQ5_PRUDU|nr:hypothetical protein L3X38_020526 [Prunus dulcis]
MQKDRNASFQKFNKLLREARLQIQGNAKVSNGLIGEQHCVKLRLGCNECCSIMDPGLGIGPMIVQQIHKLRRSSLTEDLRDAFDIVDAIYMLEGGLFLDELRDHRRSDPASAAAQPQLMDLLHNHRSNAQSRVHNAATFVAAKSKLDTVLLPNESIGHFGIALYLQPRLSEEFIEFLEACISALWNACRGVCSALSA